MLTLASFCSYRRSRPLLCLCQERRQRCFDESRRSTHGSEIETLAHWQASAMASDMRRSFYQQIVGKSAYCQVRRLHSKFFSTWAMPTYTRNVGSSTTNIEHLAAMCEANCLSQLFQQTSSKLLFGLKRPYQSKSMFISIDQLPKIIEFHTIVVQNYSSVDFILKNMLAAILKNLKLF